MGYCSSIIKYSVRLGIDNVFYFATNIRQALDAWKVSSCLVPPRGPLTISGHGQKARATVEKYSHKIKGS